VGFSTGWDENNDAGIFPHQRQPSHREGGTGPLYVYHNVILCLTVILMIQGSLGGATEDESGI
jgi:hypothetical protein